MEIVTKENHNKIQSIIKKMLGFYSEDIEQEVYMRALTNETHYQEQGKVSSWLGMITANLCRDYFKSGYFKQNASKVDADEIEIADTKTISPEDMIDQKMRQKIILKAVDSLPKKLREVVILYEFEEESYDEIANKLNISVGTVKSRLFNARTMLSEKLQFLKGEK